MLIEERKEAKKCFSRIGWYVFSILAITTLVQVILMNIFSRFWPIVYKNELITWIFAFAPMYMVAVPLSSLIIKKIPVKNIEKKKMSVGQILFCIPVAVFLMYAGDIVGIFVMNLINSITGIQPPNPLEMLLEGSIYLRILVVVIIGPIMEEYIFRKQLIDHTRIYGEKTAVILSAVLFGLFHVNLSQMFYAGTLGLLFGYIYLRTGTIRYSALLHMFVNFLGGVVAPFLMEGLNLETLSTFDPTMFSSNNIMKIALFMLYAILLFIIGIVGAILFFVNLKKVYFKQEEKELPKGIRFKTIFLNGGMLLFIAVVIWSVIKTIYA